MTTKEAETKAASAAAVQAKAKAKAEAEAEAKASEEKAAAKPATVKARVLQDCEHGKPNDLVQLGAEAAEAAEKAGLVDTHQAAIDYALTLPQNAAD